MDSDKLLLLGRIAHDIRNLANNIGLLTQATMQRTVDPLTLENICLISSDVERLGNYANDILNLSKGLQLRQSEYGCEIIRELFETVSLKFKKVKIDFQSLPLPKIRICIDYEKILSCIENLIINAIEANATEIYCSLKLCRKEKKYIMLTISDNGDGIPDEIADKIFDPFYTTKKCGTGLGLFNVISTIKAHDGDVELEIGDQTIFHLFLPII